MLSFEMSLFRGRVWNYALCAWLLLCAAAISIGGYNYASLAARADFNSYCDWGEIALNLALIIPVLAALAFAGRRVMRQLGLESGLALDFFCGVILFNILLLPFFFSGLAYRGIVLLLLVLFLLLGDSGVACPRLPRSRALSALVLIVIAWAGMHYVFSALAPVSMGESQGDVVGGYMAMDVFFSAHHGAAVDVPMGAHLFNMQQYAVVGSALVTLSNAGLVKLFGLALMFSMALGIYQFLEPKLPRWAGLIAAVLFLASPNLGNSYFFSLAHDRLYLMFVNFFVFLLIVEGKLRGESNRYWVALAGAGVMTAISMAGNIYSACALAALLPSARQWLKTKKDLACALLLFGALSAAFPIWHFTQTGCIFPGNPFFVKLFGAVGNNYIMNDFVSERVGQFYVMRTSSGAASYPLFPFNFALENMGLAAGLFFLGFAFLRSSAVRLLYGILFVQLYVMLPLVPNILMGGMASRFAWPSLPLLFLASFYFLSLWLARLREAGGGR